MAFADSSTYFGVGNSSILGQFVEKDYGNNFEFSKNLCETEWDKKMFDLGYIHLVWVNSHNPASRYANARYANVLKTRCHILLGDDDEDEMRRRTWHFKSITHYEAP